MNSTQLLCLPLAAESRLDPFLAAASLPRVPSMLGTRRQQSAHISLNTTLLVIYLLHYIETNLPAEFYHFPAMNVSCGVRERHRTPVLTNIRSLNGLSASV